jgi:hypothetical protein
MLYILGINKYKINTINNNVLNKNNNNIILDNSDIINFIYFLKTYSKINNKFIDDFFSLYDLDNNNIFIINLENIAELFKIRKDHIKKTLLYSYKLNIDYKIIKGELNGLKGKPKETILLTLKCFKLLCMQSRTKKANEVRNYLFAL